MRCREVRSFFRPFTGSEILDISIAVINLGESVYAFQLQLLTLTRQLLGYAERNVGKIAARKSNVMRSIY